MKSACPSTVLWLSAYLRCYISSLIVLDSISSRQISLLERVLLRPLPGERRRRRRLVVLLLLLVLLVARGFFFTSGGGGSCREPGLRRDVIR